jgi:uncharacterized protein YkwD
VLRKALSISVALIMLAAIGPIAVASACVGEAKAPRKLSEQLARQAIICLINQRRAHAGLGALRENASLNSSAHGHTVAMVKHNHYAHGNAAGRIRAAGYLAGASTWSTGEVLAWGPGKIGSPKHAVASWMHSPEHRHALLGGFHDIGVGMSKGAPFPHFGHNTATYTVDFGARN